MYTNYYLLFITACILFLLKFLSSPVDSEVENRKKKVYTSFQAFLTAPDVVGI